MNARDFAQRWADTWAQAWMANEVEPIAALYGESANYVTEPFREPRIGAAGAREYLIPVMAGQHEVRAWFGEPVVDGQRAAVQWWATATEDGQPLTYAGVSILTFDADGLVIDEWDAWNVFEGVREPQPGWGSVR